MKTLLILVDGMRPDALAACKAAQEVMACSVYTLEAKTVMPSVTLPCHMSLFYSVEPGRHGTTTNIYTPQVRPISGLCDVFAKARKSVSFFYGWGELRDLCLPSSLSDSYYLKGSFYGWEETNNRLTDAAINSLQQAESDLIFLYLGYPDAAGHSYGWMSAEYMRSLDNSWENIQRILSAVSKEYAVIITADHGGHNRTHGTDLPEDMTIPLIFAGAERSAIGTLQNATIMDLAPTITALAGLSPEEEWEGKSLLA